MSSDVESYEQRGHDLSQALLATECDQEEASSTSWMVQLLSFSMDLFAFIVFMYIYPIWMSLSQGAYYASLAALLSLGLFWRLFRLRQGLGGNGGRGSSPEARDLPYTTGVFTDAAGRRLYLVASVHISPRSPKDVEAVISAACPDVVMIELDEERLDTMRPKQPQAPKPEELQLLSISGPGVEEVFGESPASLRAQRAVWNAERCGENIAGKLFFDEANPYGLQRPCDSANGSIILIHRGPKDSSTVEATFPVKAHRAAQGGAKAVVVVNYNDRLPSTRLGIMQGALSVEMRVAWATKSLGFPPVPIFMVSKKDGDRLLKLCNGAYKRSEPEQTTASPQISVEVMDDLYPRRTLRRNLCQTCLLYGSGVGILYGIVRCFNVEVGGEFFTAEEVAREQGIPCVCIDVDMNRLMSRVRQVAIPTPRNLVRVLWTWLALPRCAFRLCFPKPSSVDTLGSMLLHARSFPLRHWLAFFLAGFAASFVSSNILNFLSGEATGAAVDVKVVKRKDTADFQVLLMWLVELYLMPCLYEAVLASRDEAMYEGIRARARATEAKCMVAVTGAAHTNGILQRCHERGL